MTCKIDKILDGAGMKSHASMLGTFFVYTLALCMPIFKKKYSLKRLEKSSKLFPRRFREDFFLKIGIQRAKVYTKNVPNIEACDFIPAPSRILSIKQVIVVLY